MSAEERLRVAQDMDMSEVSREFERIVPATVKNIISGKVRTWYVKTIALN
jgi:hypothetical protein